MTAEPRRCRYCRAVLSDYNDDIICAPCDEAELKAKMAEFDDDTEEEELTAEEREKRAKAQQEDFDRYIRHREWRAGGRFGPDPSIYQPPTRGRPRWSNSTTYVRSVR